MASSLPPSIDTDDASPKPGGVFNVLMRPVWTLHAFLADAPDTVSGERRDQYALTNWCMVLALGAHATFICLFLALDIMPLVLFNVGSALLFAVGLFVAKKGWSNTAMGMAFVEVPLHAIYATLMLGYASGFHYHLVLAVVVVFMLTDISAALRTAAVALMATVYVALTVLTVRSDPWVVVPDDVSNGMMAFNVVVFITTLSGISGYYTLAVTRARAALRLEFQRSETLLHNVLPVAIADRLKEDRTIADHFEACSVLFADMAGFTAWSSDMSPDELVGELNAIFSAFDEFASEMGLEKIKTIGDAYMVAVGIPESREDHAQALARMALRMQGWMKDHRGMQGGMLELRIGVHSGPAVAGVIGLRKFIYDLWGDTVNTAARMESHGINGEIQVSEATAALLQAEFLLEDRGVRAIKGKGPMRTFLVRGER